MESNNISATYNETVRAYINAKHNKNKLTIDELFKLQDKHNITVKLLEFQGVHLPQYNFLSLK